MIVSTQPFVAGAALSLIAIALWSSADGPATIPLALLVVGVAFVVGSLRRG